MKKTFFALLAALAFFNAGHAQNDTMYLMKAGAVVGKYNVNTQVDSIIFYDPQTQPGTTFIDPRDGNVYPLVTIGDQVWMAENLKYLPSVEGPGTGSQTSPYYYVYGYDGIDVDSAKTLANYITYGVLYNWPAAMIVCPSGWHLPGDAEWTTLTTYLGGDSVAGGKLKETGTSHWSNPNVGATNETGFTALPGGFREPDGVFDGLHGNGYWYSATETNSSDAWERLINYNAPNVYRESWGKDLGWSVRCVRD
jgi:uncharacterized protein (TIGR02145 family)